MAAEIFTALSNLRIILDTETDADFPINETTYTAIRYTIESLIILALSTGVTGGSATSDPPDDSTGVLADTGAAYTADEHNGRALLMTSGLAKGTAYTIDDTATQSLTCTGDNLYADGVRSGDDYHVLYDTKVNADGHDHDSINSAKKTTDSGELMLVAYDHEGGTEHTNAGAWATQVTHRVYVSPTDTMIRCAFNMKISVADSDGADARVLIGGKYSDTVNRNNVNYDWEVDSTGVDVSSLSGWYDFEVQLQRQTGRTAYVQGYAMYKE